MRVQINLLRLEPHEIKAQERALRPRRRFAPLVGIASLLFIVLGTTSAFSYQQSQDENSKLNATLNGFISGRFHFVELPDRTLTGEAEDRINILLLGIGGKNHDGPYLSDTNIILSIKPSTRQLALISIPRDLLVPLDNYGWRKVNNANAFGEMENPGKGAEKARDAISKVLNITIPYYVRIDFSGFSQIVDTLGGLSVTVDRAFTDYTYPAANFKYQTVSFKEGAQIMDGERALKFARSRHSGHNNEGSDFARSKRQQKIIAALKEKIFSTDFLLNPGKITNVLFALKENISTNIRSWELVRFATFAKLIDQNKMASLVFDDGPKGYLVSNTIDGAYVLQPRDGTYEAMQLAVKNIFVTDEMAQESAKKVRVAVFNGTNQAGLAATVSTLLSGAGVNVVTVGNANTKDHASTTIYSRDDTTDRQSNEQQLSQLLNASVVKGIPTDLSSSTDIDFVIVLGKDAATQ